jgi:hypothetical protein
MMPGDAANIPGAAIRKDLMTMPNVPEDLTGRTFGRWTVLALLPKEGLRRRRWLCRCECGTEREVWTSNLRTGASTGCGCERLELNKARLLTHGLSTRPEYFAWYDAVARCHDPKRASYPDYGGRGIFMCERWRESPENFYADMGPRPSPAHSLDPIDNDGPYSPENCRWATQSTQNRNRRVNRLVTFDGETLTLADWCDRTGLHKATLLNRLRSGWSVRDALTLPPSRSRRR